MTPTRMLVFARFMHATGAIAHAPENWKDLFFPVISGLNGS